MQRPPVPNPQLSSDPAAPSTRYSWAVVGMLWFICFFNYADRQAIFSVFPVLEEEFGFSKAELGLIGSAFAAVYGITAPFAGQISDRSSRKLVILGGLYIWSVVTGFTAAVLEGLAVCPGSRRRGPGRNGVLPRVDVAD